MLHDEMRDLIEKCLLKSYPLSELTGSLGRDSSFANFIVIEGDAGIGKTWFLKNLAENLNQNIESEASRHQSKIDKLLLRIKSQDVAEIVHWAGHDAIQANDFALEMLLRPEALEQYVEQVVKTFFRKVLAKMKRYARFAKQAVRYEVTTVTTRKGRLAPPRRDEAYRKKRDFTLPLGFIVGSMVTKLTSGWSERTSIFIREQYQYGY